jgi:hypothetical protein
MKKLNLFDFMLDLKKLEFNEFEFEKKKFD